MCYEAILDSKLESNFQMPQKSLADNIKKCPVFVEIYGGLGNQLFQMAFANLLSNHGYHPILINCNASEKPGKLSRVTQVNQIVPDTKIYSGLLPSLVRKISLSSKVRKILSRTSLFKRLDDNMIASSYATNQCIPKDINSWSVLCGFWQEWYLTEDSHTKLFTEKLRTSLIRLAQNRPDITSMLALDSPRKSVILHVRKGIMHCTLDIKC